MRRAIIAGGYQALAVGTEPGAPNRGMMEKNLQQVGTAPQQRAQAHSVHLLARSALLILVERFGKPDQGIEVIALVHQAGAIGYVEPQHLLLALGQCVPRPVSLFPSSFLFGLQVDVKPQPRAEQAECRHEDGAQQRRPRGTASNPLDGSFPTRCRSGQDWFAVKETLQVVREFSGCGVALRRPLLQAFQANGFQVARHTAVELARRHRDLLSNLSQRLHHRCGLKRRSAGQQTVKHRSQAVDI